MLALVLVLGAGCRRWRWRCELAVHVVETGLLVLVPGAGAGRVPVPVMVLGCAWWRQVAGAGRRCWCCQGLCTVCAHTVVRTLFYVQRQALNGALFQHVSACYTQNIVVLDTAWPWASEAYGLCRLCALFCAHKLTRARSYGLIVLQIVVSSALQGQ